MTSMNSEILEEKCIEFYSMQILLQFDPDFFESADNIKEFERLTLGKALSLKKINRLKENIL
jgi:hypothetical protein